MHTSTDGFVRTDMWREGKWLDLWSVVHFLSGVSIGLGFYYLQFGPIASFMLALVCLIAYELWEALVKIEEMPTNRFMDVVVGMVSFVPTFYLVAPLIHPRTYIAAFCAVFFVNILLSAIGWRASQKAALFEKRFRQRVHAERERLVERGEELRGKLLR